MNEFYVYQLRLENSNLPFYIGKGKGKRWKQHTKPSSLTEKATTIKDNIIKKALREGVKVISEKLCINMT